MDKGFNQNPEGEETVKCVDGFVPLWTMEQLQSEALSEMATCSIFCWLRTTGYPRTEQGMYRHVWISPDVEDSSDGEDEKLDGGFNVDKLRDAIDIGDRRELKTPCS